VKEQDVTVAQAYFGHKLEVETPWGKGSIRIPPLSQSGHQLRVKGHGIRQNEFKGDLFIRLNVRIPVRVDEEAEKIVRQLESLYE